MEKWIEELDRDIDEKEGYVVSNHQALNLIARIEQLTAVAEKTQELVDYLGQVHGLPTSINTGIMAILIELRQALKAAKGGE